MGKGSNKGYKFDVQDGVISAIYEIKNGRTKLKSIDQDEQWTVDGEQIVKTEYEHGRQEITRYVDADGDGIYSKLKTTSGTRTASDDRENTPDDSSDNDAPSDNLSRSEKYVFEFSDGMVIGAFELEHGVQQPESLDDNERYVVDGNDVLKIESKRAGDEITRYEDVDGDGFFAKADEYWVAKAVSPTLIGVNTDSSPAAEVEILS